MAKICTVNYCCDNCGKPITVNFDADMAEDKENETILKDKFCKYCGGKLTAAESLSKMFVEALRGIEREIQNEKSGIENDKIKFENDRVEFEKTEREKIERLQIETKKLENDVIRYEKKEIDIKFSTENLMRENAFTRDRIEEYKNKKAEEERINAMSRNITEGDIDEMTGETKGYAVYNRLINNVSGDDDSEIRAFANEIYLQMTPDGVFEEDMYRGVKCYIREIDGGEMYELYPSAMVRYLSARKDYADFYHFDGDGSIINVKDVCCVCRRGEIYKIERMGKIIFEKRNSDA
ncbi:MAG: hypothetical protein IJ736_02360 [Firmicutes bacterium]|nr:hypothetical protein [Bacillota bacterium]